MDDYTVDFVTDGPNPILHSEWATWYIMDKEWSEANNAAAPTSLAEGTDNFAAFNANAPAPSRSSSARPMSRPFWSRMTAGGTRRSTT